MYTEEVESATDNRLKKIHRFVSTQKDHTLYITKVIT